MGGYNFMLNRRKFIQQSSAALAGLGLIGVPITAYPKDRYTKVTILHTNDVHSRIEPFPPGGKRAGLGGFARRAALLKQIRQQEEHVLLLDAGDMIQGTAYFNLFQGDLEIKLMNELGYDAVTIGNHDFDAGMDGLENMINKANFPFISSNYNFSNTLVHNKVYPHHIFKRGDVTIGVFGLGIELDGLVPPDKHGETQYNQPINVAANTANLLKNERACDLVICLSHLGIEYDFQKPSDSVLAQSVNNIDLIIGGHTHTLLDQPKTFANPAGQRVLVNQVGWAGTHVGLIEYFFEKKSGKKTVQPHTVIPT